MGPKKLLPVNSSLPNIELVLLYAKVAQSASNIVRLTSEQGCRATAVKPVSGEYLT